MRVIWRVFWKVAIIRLINDREKKELLAVPVLREYNAERRMTDFANHSSFCFEVLSPRHYAVLMSLKDALSLSPSIVRSLFSFWLVILA